MTGGRWKDSALMPTLQNVPFAYQGGRLPELGLGSPSKISSEEVDSDQRRGFSLILNLVCFGGGPGRTRGFPLGQPI